MRYSLFALAPIAFLAACSASNRQAAHESTPSAATVTANAASAYTNPFAYCRAVITADRPDARYTGKEPPPAVVAGLRKALGSPESAEPAPVFLAGIHWRCMDGAVYACTVGANLPCMSKANTDQTPTEGERNYCSENHDALFIPMYVTGHNTIYAWRCKDGAAMAGKTRAEVDKRGYIADIWYRIAPSD